MKKYLTLLAVASAAVLLTGCGIGSKKSASTEQPVVTTTGAIKRTSTPEGLAIPQRPEIKNISIKSGAYSPASLTVKAGTVINRTNDDTVSHTVTAGDGSFGGIIAKGKTFSYTFNKLGTYNYHCNFHKGMTGSIIVTE